jgi:aromatic ring-opening dioxygenase catalytic subunit (LigB family)
MDSGRGFDHGTFVPLKLVFPKADIPIVQLSLLSSMSPEVRRLAMYWVVRHITEKQTHIPKCMLQEHVNMGKALAPLRGEGVLIIGSGMTYHNMRGFRSNEESAVAASQVYVVLLLPHLVWSKIRKLMQLRMHAQAFDAYLADAIANPEHNAEQRLSLLRGWDKAPAARECHPREEHLMPLHVVAGAAQGEPGRVVQTGMMLGVKVSSFQFDG